jgi:prepilin-type N-terminal cleavage/methylation domain-containing protein
MMERNLKLEARRAAQRGYNLVEMLIAIAFLAVVLLTVLTLFFLGSGNVYSGKQQTMAVSIGTDVMEDIAEFGVTDLYGAFVVNDGNAPTGVATIPANSAGTASTMPQSRYPASIVRSTYVRSATTELGYPNGLLSQWRALLYDASGKPKLNDPSISIVLTPREKYPTTAANLTVGPTGNATVLRVRVLVRWREGIRFRQVVLDSTKTRKPS